jgi:hypothetical protein
MNLAADIRFALDPCAFASAVGIQCDPWQADFLQSDSKRTVINSSRQSGKSLVVAIKSLHTALYNSSSLQILVSPSQRQSAELLRSCLLLYGKIDGAQQLDTESVLKLEFQNGSRIVALPGTERTIRGMSGAAAVTFDEASRCEESLFVACRAMVATSNGSLTLLSTPAGRHGQFFTLWHNGDPAWKRIGVPASLCPRISKEFLASELKEMGPLEFSQEYGLAFIEDQGATWNTAIIDSSFSSNLRPLWS